MPDLKSWNEAHERLRRYLETFDLGDEVLVARLTLRLLDEARDLHRTDPSADPTSFAMRHAQTELSQWLATNLNEKSESASQILASGYTALLLSRLSQNEPGSFLAEPLPENIRQSLQHTLVVTGPDLNISSMTPRHLDFGPMLGLARHTWHRWDTKSFVTALLFWLGVYGTFFWLFTGYL